MRVWSLMLALGLVACTGSVASENDERSEDRDVDTSEESRESTDTKGSDVNLRPTGISTTPTGPNEGISTSPSWPRP